MTQVGEATLKRICVWALAVVLLAGPAVAQPKAPAEDAKWFVVRDKDSGHCWPSLLIRIDGQYQHGTTLLAGGPFDTKAKASERIKVLATQGSCAVGER
jgi:hypothetical protein